MVDWLINRRKQPLQWVRSKIDLSNISVTRNVVIWLPRKIFVQDMNFLAFRVTLWPGRYQGSRLQKACTLQFSASIIKIACEIGDPTTPHVILFVWRVERPIALSSYIFKDDWGAAEISLLPNVSQSQNQFMYRQDVKESLFPRPALNRDISEVRCGCLGIYPVGFWKPSQLETA